jgi:hypothetical protein
MAGSVELQVACINAPALFLFFPSFSAEVRRCFAAAGKMKSPQLRHYARDTLIIDYYATIAPSIIISSP